MSINRRLLSDGTHSYQVKYRVRDRKTGCVSWETETFGPKYDGGAVTAAEKDERRRLAAEEHQQEVSGHARSGTLDRVSGARQTLDEFIVRDWKKTVGVRRSRRRREVDAYLWAAHVSPRIGQRTLREMEQDTQIADEWVQWMEAPRSTSDPRPRVGRESRRRAIQMVGSVMRLARKRRFVSYNPIDDVAKPPTKRERAVRPWHVSQVEAMRSWLMDDARLPDLSVPFIRRCHNNWRDTRVEDAGLLSALAYAGLRPEEALALRLCSIQGAELMIEEAIVDGEAQGTKTERIRKVGLIGPLADDLRAVAAATGATAPEDFIWRNPDGSAWSDARYRYWRRRPFQLAAAAIGLGSRVKTERGWRWRSPDGRAQGPRPYEGRHTFLSRLLHVGTPPAEVAEQGGQSVKVLLGTYTHRIDDPEVRPGETLEQHVRRARGQDVSNVRRLRKRKRKASTSG